MVAQLLPPCAEPSWTMTEAGTCQPDPRYVSATDRPELPATGTTADVLLVAAGFVGAVTYVLLSMVHAKHKAWTGR